MCIFAPSNLNAMQRIKLTRNEKRLLRNIAANVDYFPDGMSDEAISCAAAALERCGLILVSWSSGHIVASTELTEFGVSYIIDNPHLHNPIPWRWIVGTAITIATLIVSIIALLTACIAMNV